MSDLDTWIVVAGIIVLVAYLSPVWIAFYRGHRFRWPILGLSTVGGWTGVGWAAAFIWAVWPGQGRLTTEPAPTEPAENVQAQGGDRFDQLARLGQLKAAGALTDAEFQAEKNRIFAS